MLDFLRDHEARPRFIGYLRDPVSFTRSAMQERLKVRLFAALPFLPDAPLEKAYHLVVDRLDRLSDAIPSRPSPSTARFSRRVTWCAISWIRPE